MMRRSPAWMVVASLGALVAGCQAPRDAVVAVVERQADAWNRGDLRAFMDGYWRSPRLSFSAAGKTHFGWDAVLARYEQRYPVPAAMGKLEFSELDYESLGPDAALLLGRWRLARESGPVGGNFSLIFRRVNGQWVIVHDHTSSDP